MLLQASDDFIGALVHKTKGQDSVDISVDDDLKKYIVDPSKGQCLRLTSCQKLAITTISNYTGENLDSALTMIEVRRVRVAESNVIWPI